MRHPEPGHAKGHPVFLLLGAIVAAFLLSAPAGAEPISAGTVELGTDSFFQYSSVYQGSKYLGRSSQLQVSAALGYFITSMVEVEGALLFGFDILDPPNDKATSSTALGGRGALVLNFPGAGPMIPYIKVGYGWLNFYGDGFEDSINPTLFPLLGVGLRGRVGSSAAVNTGLQYRRVENAGGIQGRNERELLVGVGVSLFLGTGGS